MSRFYTVKVKEIIRETPDSVSIVLDIPSDLKDAFAYKHGQYLTFKYGANGSEIRRSYSLCSSPFTGEPLKVTVKEVAGGKFSAFANKTLKVGDSVEIMGPEGNFTTALSATHKKHYAAFAAGSGITPVMSILKSVLKVEPESRFTLVYGNRTPDNVIFKAELESLTAAHKNLTVQYVFSRSGGKDENSTGRIDKNKIPKLLSALGIEKADEYFICGPEELIMGVKEILEGRGIDKKKIHFELFTTPVKMAEKNTEALNFTGESEVTVIMNGAKTTFKLKGNGKAVLDAAIDNDVDAPFSCKGAVCCTCKARVLEGKASMEMNYALTDDEVADGYILTCQSHPLTPTLVVDFDV